MAHSFIVSRLWDDDKMRRAVYKFINTNTLSMVPMSTNTIKTIKTLNYVNYIYITCIYTKV